MNVELDNYGIKSRISTLFLISSSDQRVKHLSRRVQRHFHFLGVCLSFLSPTWSGHPTGYLLDKQTHQQVEGL